MVDILSKSAALRKGVQDAGRALLLLSDFQQHLDAGEYTDESRDSEAMSNLRALITPANVEPYY
jgi:hypothetical protein